MIAPSEIQKTIETLEGIVNSTSHPETAMRALLVELKPIRKEIIRLNELIRRENQELSYGNEID